MLTEAARRWRDFKEELTPFQRAKSETAGEF
jgi:hypothetical protein